MNEINLRGKTVEAEFVLKNGEHLFNGTVLCNGMTAVTSYGSLGAELTMLSCEDDRITVSSTAGLWRSDWLILTSDQNFSPIDSGKRGEWARIKEISVDTILLEQVLMGRYERCYVPILPRVRISNVKFIAGPGAQYAVRAYLNHGTHIENCYADGFAYAAYSMETCLGGSVAGCEADREDHSTGAAYGAAITGGCDGVSVLGGRYSSVRHGVSVGGTLFTNRGITVQGTHTAACSDAGVDVHPNCVDAAITGNTIDGNCTDTTQTGDGICAQGMNTTITGNIVRNHRREGILVQPLTVKDGACTVTGNIVQGEHGILIDNQSTAAFSVALSGNILVANGRQIQIQSIGGRVTYSAAANHGSITTIGNVRSA